ncbi:alpha/beta hydrolase fold domain-containing protein [Bauldia litoralis]|uniref:Acetyl esterase/lipase n=1 Tax=Bauldia litoralis TaxID=665467 RepID=A0A1G6BUZ7_9HYPH|nr:alpha/beta hydrolase fold domain-containing protein [Bauldia litoralis]SDB24446.1 Acetyl esterase/lipase [Bauldia litoralis]
MAIVSFETVHRKTRAGRSTEVRRSLKQLIMLGELPPGAALLELEIAARFACSQGSVREALLALQDEGLVIRQPHRGTRVSDCTAAEAQEMFRLRHSIETRALARALPNIDADLVEALRASVRAMEQAARDNDEYALSELDRAFHRRLLAAADLPALEPILHRCLVHNQRFKITRSGAARDLEKTAARHWTIVNAIESGDRDAAVTAIGHHVATIVDPGPEIFPDINRMPMTTPARTDSLPKPTAEMQAMLDRLAREDAGLPDPTTIPPEEGRALAERKNARWQVEQPEMETVRTFAVPPDPDLETTGNAVMLFRPPNAGSGAILFVHGGGFAFCSLRTHERFMRVLAAESGRAVIGVEYRLAPENPFPAGLNDVIAAWRAVQADPAAYGIDPGGLVLSGDSAGANLALAATLHEIEASLPVPDGCLLFYGTYAVDFSTPSYNDFAEGFGLTTAMMQRYWDWYAPDAGARSGPLAAPMAASDDAIRALPPLHLLVAECDPLASDTHALAARLKRLGRDDDMRVEPGVVHGFLQMTQHLAAARASVSAAAMAANRFLEDANKNGRND